MTPYSDPNHTIRRESFHTTVAGATTESCKFRAFQKFTLKKVHAVVVTAGTATPHKLDIYSGTTSVGTIPLSTNTAGYAASSAALDLPIASLAQISVKSGADATGVAHVIFEYTTDHDAVQSV